MKPVQQTSELDERMSVLSQLTKRATVKTHDEEIPLVENVTAAEVQDQLTFDDILTQSGFGKYQWKLVLLMALVDICDAAEIIMISMIQGILNKEWGLNKFWDTMLLVSLFLGFMLGAFFSGAISRFLGRKNSLVYIVFLAFVVSLLSAFARGILEFVIYRSIFGFCVGLVGPVVTSLVTESVPVAYRSKLISLTGIPFVIGQLFAITLGYLILDSLNSGDWRTYLVILAMPMLFVSIFAILLLDNTPRYELLMGDLDEGIKETEKMVEENGVNLEDEEEFENWQQKLRNWAIRMRQMDSYASKESFSDLFKGKYSCITPILWIVWFSDVFIYYGLIFMVPYTISRMNNAKGDEGSAEDIADLYWGSLAELPAVLFTWVIADTPAFGRRKSLIFSFLMLPLSMCFLLYNGYSVLIVTSAFGKFFIGMAFILSYLYTLEIYETANRVTGLGSCSGMGRLGGIVMPIISIYGSEMANDVLFPYKIFLFAGLISALALMTIDVETQGQQLDQQTSSITTTLNSKSIKPVSYVENVKND